jgi:hypothetical protein
MAHILAEEECIMLVTSRNLAAALLMTAALAPARAQEVLLSRTGVSPAVATSGRGDFVIVWVDRTDILASVLPKGARQPRAPFPVSLPSADRQANPDVAMDAAGRFAVVWQDGLEDFGGTRVVGESFGAAGARQSPEIRLSPAEAGPQLTPQVAMQEDGSFVAAWVENRPPHDAIKAARFSAGGSPLGPEMEMKAGGEINYGAQVASFPGGFAVGWTQYYECSGARFGYIGAVARFDPEGQRTGKTYYVGTSRCDSSGPGALVALVGSRAGALAVFAGAQEAVVQRFDPSGEPVGGRFPLSRQTCTEGHCTTIGALTMDNAGRFAVIWQTFEPGSSRLAAQLFSPRGRPLTGLVPVSDLPSTGLDSPAAALADDGTLAVVWRREGAADPERNGLFLWRRRLQ